MTTTIKLGQRYERLWEITTEMEQKNFEVMRSGVDSQFIFFTIGRIEYEVRITGAFVEIQLIQKSGKTAARNDRYTAVFIDGTPHGTHIAVDETKPLTLGGVEIIRVKRKI
jgi:hypothetical protein